MKETVEQFYDRIYTNFCNDKVYVYDKRRGKGNAEQWTTETAKNYVQWLESDSVEENKQIKQLKQHKRGLDKW